MKQIEAIVIGTSAGGLNAISILLENISADYPIPFILVQHRGKDQDLLLEEILQNKINLKVKQADEKEAILPGHLYVAPPDYHLLIESDRTFALNSDPPVRFSRPSIDVLFISAAEVYREKLCGIILTGANSDGTEGIRIIKKHKGCTIAQKPEEADVSMMPASAIATKAIDKVMGLKEISAFLQKLAGRNRSQ